MSHMQHAHIFDLYTPSCVWAGTDGPRWTTHQVQGSAKLPGAGLEIRILEGRPEVKTGAT